MRKYLWQCPISTIVGINHWYFIMKNLANCYGFFIALFDGCDRFLFTRISTFVMVKADHSQIVADVDCERLSSNLLEMSMWLWSLLAKPISMNSYFYGSLKVPLAMVGTIHSQILVKVVYERLYTQFPERFL
jgi:hypothetical protein